MERYFVLINYVSIKVATTVHEHLEIIHNVTASSEEEAIGQAYIFFEKNYPNCYIIRIVPQLVQ